MTTQYGFTSTPAVVQGVKRASWPAKTLKISHRMSALDVFTNTLAVIGSRITGHGTRMCSLTTCLSPVTTVVTPPVLRCVRVVLCISVMMVCGG